MTILFIGILATYRLSRMLAYEDGPWDLFIRWRTWIISRFNPTDLTHAPDHWIVRGFNCPLCLSFWIGAILAIANADNMTHYILSAFAYSGGATWLIKQERSEE